MIMSTTEENKPKTNAELELEMAQMRKELAIAQAEIKDQEAIRDSVLGKGLYTFTPKLTESVLSAILASISEELRTEVEAWVSGPELSPDERQRLRGASQRRYGFINAVGNMMQVNPQFIPANVNEHDYKDEIRKFELVRNINITLNQIMRITQDIQLVMADSLYRKALSYYGAVRDSTLRRVDGAQVLFESLRTFFRHHRRTHTEPTEHEVQRDARALLHGHKDGKILIENQHPHLVGGKHIVVDETN